jgi:hypothetical protein
LDEVVVDWIVQPNINTYKQNKKKIVAFTRIDLALLKFLNFHKICPSFLRTTFWRVLEEHIENNYLLKLQLSKFLNI